MKYILLIALIVSCSSIRPINEEAKDIVEKKLPLVEQVKEVTLRPGKATFVDFYINLNDGKIILDCGKKKVSFIVLNKKAKTLMGETYFSKMKPYKCIYDKKEVLSIKVKDFPYKSEKLNVNKSRVTLSKKNLARVIKEREIKRKIYLKSSSYFLFNEPFEVPLDSYITSHYGNRRLFNNKIIFNHPYARDFKNTTGDDLRWIHRRINGLSRAEINKALSLSKYPKDIHSLLLEKLLSRINKLSEYYSLDTKFTVQKDITVGNIQNGKLMSGDYPNYVVEFHKVDPENPYRFSEVFRLFKNQKSIWEINRFFSKYST